jgi:hypothetical protein
MSNEGNPDTPVTELDSASVSNQAAFSFDEVEELTMSDLPDEKVIKEVKKAERQAAQEEKVEVTEKKEEHEEVTVDEDNLTPEDVQEVSADEDAEDALNEIREAAEITDDTTVEVKVDGEVMEVPLKDLKNNYAGKTAWDKRFTELDKERKEHSAKVERIEKYVGDFVGKVKNGDVLDALEMFAKAANKDPLEFRREIKQKLLTQVEEYAKMTDEQRKIAEMQEENDYLRRSQESEAVQIQQEKSQRALELELDRIQEVHGVDTSRLIEVNDKLLESGYREDQITPALLEEYHITDMAFSKAETVVDQFFPSTKDSDAKYETILNVVAGKVKNDLNMTNEDIKEFIETTFAIVSPEKNRAKTISKKVSQKPAPKQSKRTVENYLSFDAFEDLD